jgi:hypothetical protein
MNHSCGKLPGGAKCSSDGQCQSTHCTDGVCCEKASCGTCNSCAGSGDGTCTAKTGYFPNDCPPADSYTCGNTGSCVNGACAQYAKGTQCSSFECYANGAWTTFTGTCMGDGSPCSLQLPPGGRTNAVDPCPDTFACVPTNTANTAFKCLHQCFKPGTPDGFNGCAKSKYCDTSTGNTCFG